MGETQLNVTLLAHTQLNDIFHDSLYTVGHPFGLGNATDGQAVALSAIRTCYSPLKPSEILHVEGDKYFCNSATDGEGGTEADRLFRLITRSGHTSTLEHVTFTFAIEGVSRALLAQLTRHRHFSFSVQSQRYVKLGSGDKSGGFDYVVPESIQQNQSKITETDGNGEPCGWYDNAFVYFESIMEQLQQAYDNLRSAGIPAEDARAVLPNATATNLVMTANLRSLLEFYAKRRNGKGAQSEIVNLAETLRKCVVEVEPWLDAYFEVAQ